MLSIADIPLRAANCVRTNSSLLMTWGVQWINELSTKIKPTHRWASVQATIGFFCMKSSTTVVILPPFETEGFARHIVIFYVQMLSHSIPALVRHSYVFASIRCKTAQSSPICARFNTHTCAHLPHFYVNIHTNALIRSHTLTHIDRQFCMS